MKMLKYGVWIIFLIQKFTPMLKGKGVYLLNEKLSTATPKDRPGH